MNAGTGGITFTSTGTGDITINSDDTLLLDSDGVLELNSSGGAISIGNDDNDQAINIGTQGERAISIGTGAFADTITIGNVTGGTEVNLNAGTGGITLASSGTGDITIDSSNDIVLDADSGDILLKDNGTTYGSFTNSSGNIILKSGTTTSATFTGCLLYTSPSPRDRG